MNNFFLFSAYFTPYEDETDEILKKVFLKDFLIVSRAWLSLLKRQLPLWKETGKMASSSNYLWTIMRNCPGKLWNPVVLLENWLPAISIRFFKRENMSPIEMPCLLSKL